MQMKFPKFKLIVTKKNAFCYHNYNVGDEFIFEDFTHPPKHFCQGAMHSIFPCMYALTFGAKFPFMPNQHSILTTCPDGGKLEFKTEILKEDGQVDNLPKPDTPSGPNPKKLIVKVEEVTGKCFYQYKVGDTFELQGLKTKEGFCGAAYHTLFPALFALNFGAEYPFEENKSKLTTVTCPDGGYVRFSVERA